MKNLRSHAEALLESYRWQKGEGLSQEIQPPDVWDLWTALQWAPQILSRSLARQHLEVWLADAPPSSQSLQIAGGTPFEQAVFSAILLAAYGKQTADPQLFGEYSQPLEASLLGIARHPVTWLVSSPREGRLSTLFGDVPFEGEELVPSLLLINAARLLASLWENQGNGAKAGEWRDFGEMVVCGVKTLYNVDGFFYAATRRQVVRSVWGSALAVHLGVTTPLQSATIAKWLRQSLSLIAFKGRIHALPYPALWDSCAEKTPFRALPLQWVCSALERHDAGSAGSLLKELLDDYAAFGVFESIEKEDSSEPLKRSNPGSLSSLWPLISEKIP